MAKSLMIVCAILISVLAGNGGLAIRNTDFSKVLNLLNEHHETQHHETQQSESEETGFDESDVETRDLVIPLTTVPENGGIYCHGEEFDQSEKFIVGFEPIIDNNDVNHIALYGCLQGPSSQIDEWQCTGEDTVCIGPSVLMFDWKQGKCDDYLARSELITIGGRYIKHVVLVVGYERGGYESSSGLELKLMSTELKDTPGLTKSVEYFSSSFNYVSKCLDGETSSSSPEDDSSSLAELEDESEIDTEEEEEDTIDEDEDGEEDMEEGEEGEEEAGEEEEGVVEETSDDFETEGSEKAESSMTFYESSLPRYDSSFIDSNADMEYAASSVADDYADPGTSEVTGDVSDSEESEDEYYESSVEALINYLAEYWDETIKDTRSLSSTGWWPRQDIPVGQIAGLDIDSRGNLVLFRRGERSWSPNDFDSDNVYIYDTAIQEQTLLVVDPSSGNIVEAWGKDRFYLPHGLTIDYQNNIWLTDVAMHQVFKFSHDSDEPEMTFGQAFSPGSDADHLCKPTDVAVCPKTGDIFIADGYCNNRILKYAANGTFLFEITAHASDDVDADSDLTKFRIPHSLAMIESMGWICVADRENARIQCFNGHDGTFAKEFSSPELGREVFAIAYKPIDNVLYAVNGPRLHRSDVITSGFTFDLDSGEIVDKWTPAPEHFGVLHDIAVSPQDDSVFVADIETNRVWRFDKSSNVLSNRID